MHILVIEDDAKTASYLHKGLSESGHSVDHAADGKDGLFLAMEGGYDALIVDRMLPQLDGIEVCRSIRQKNSYIPIWLPRI